MPSASGSLAFLGAARFQGYWNATSNNATGSGLVGGVTGPVNGLFLTGTSSNVGGYASPTGLTASAGDYWQITGSGTHNVDGNASWRLNDWCIYSGSAGGTGNWIKLAFEDTIASIVLGDLSSSSFHLGAANNKHVIFASGSVHSGSNNFVFDYTNNRVGIGTSTPGSALSVRGDSNAVNVDISAHGAGFGVQPSLHLKRARGTEASKAVVQDGDTLGAINFYGYNDADNQYDVGASIGAQVDGEPSTGTDSSDMPTKLVFLTADDGGATATTRMTIKPDGKIGIGTANPQRTLSVTGSLDVSGNGSLRSLDVVDDAVISGNIRVADDKKVIFGANNDAHIEYNENGDNFLIISGSHAAGHGGGTVISGSMLVFDSNTVASGTIAGPGSYLAVKSTGQVVLTSSSGKISAVANGANNRVATFGSADTLNGEIGLQFDGSTLDVAGDISLPDDKKVIFGTNSDAHIEYDENGTDYLIISGSTNGIALSGSSIEAHGVLKVAQFVERYGDPNTRIRLDDDEVRIEAGAVTFASFKETTQNIIKLNHSLTDVDLALYKNVSATPALFVSGSDGVIHSHYGVVVHDDKKLIFGSADDAHIEYNENGDDFLIISGSTNGIALSGTMVQVSGNMAVKYPNYFAVTSNANHSSASFYVQTGQGAQFHGGADNGGVTIRDAGDVHIADNKKVIFGNNEDASFEYDEDGTDTLLYAGASIRIPDDTKLEFGSVGEGHIEYNENGDNSLTISGSHGGGTVISGSKLIFDSVTVASGTIAGPGSYLAVKSNGQVVLTSSAAGGGGGAVSAVVNGVNNRIATFSSADALNGESAFTFDGSDVRLTGNFNFDNDERSINFGPNSSSPALIKYNQGGGGAEFLTISGSNQGGTVISGSKIVFEPHQQSHGVMFTAGDIVIVDDVKLAFGTLRESHIEYNENGDDFLIVSGSSKGVALSGSVVKLDGAMHADAGFDGLHQITGSLHITGSDGASLQLKSTGSVSFRLEADTDNSVETQNPFIELMQDGGLTDFTIGLTKISQSPEGASIKDMADNTLAIGSNTDTTNATHIQFYHRATASFSLIDKGSTNHAGLGGAVDLQGFRVGVGPGFSEANFPKGRMEIHNTSTSPVPALYLAVSGTAQPALIADTANTTRNVVEISGSSLTTGDLMHLYSDSSNTSDRSLLKITNDNASSEKVTLIELKQDAFSYPAFIQRGGGTIKNLPTFNTSLTGSQTIAITHLIEGSYFAVGRDAGKTDTTPTSAQIVARIKDAAAGDSFEFAYFNASLNDVTLAGGTNVKMVNTAAASFSIAAGKGRKFVFVLKDVGSGTEQVDMIPQSDLFTLNS